MPQPTADDVRKSSMATLASAHAVYVEAARKLAGQDGLEAVGEANRIHGLELGKAAIVSGGLRPGDLRSIYEFFIGAHPYFGFEIELLADRPDEMEMKVTYCPWIDTFREKNAQKDICEWVCKMDEGIGQAVAPDIRMTLPKCMMRGDSYCIYRYSRD
ncbi:MAG: L-2-amino-thiazoline-4-carboxylic acid hydrolase [Candidatus Thorarchaeota archaeon]